MRTIIEVECIDQELKIVNKPLVASGGLHENFISFTFCSLWDGFVKTAVFYRNEKEPYYSIIDEAGMCEVPHEVTDDQGVMYFGVFGVLGDVTRTSRIMRYQIRKGAVTTSLVPPSPTPDIWEQLLSNYKEVLDKVEESNQAQHEFISEANLAVRQCEQATDECNAAIALLNHTSEDMDGGDPSTEDSSEDYDDANGGSPY